MVKRILDRCVLSVRDIPGVVTRHCRMPEPAGVVFRVLAGVSGIGDEYFPWMGGQDSSAAANTHAVTADHAADRGVGPARPLAEKRCSMTSARPPAEVAFLRARPGTLRSRTGSDRNMHARSWQASSC